MATWDVSYALTMIRRVCRIPDTTEYPAASDLYEFLRDGENRVKHEIGAVVPEILYNAPTLMTSADGGYTYTFGTDSEGNAISPIGHVKVYPNRESVPFAPLMSGREYVFEGTRIRMVEYTPQTFASGPYGQWIAPTLLIDGSTNAFTLPVSLRDLAVYDACRQYADTGGAQDSSVYEKMFQQELVRQVTTAQLNRVAGQIAYPRAQAAWGYGRRGSR